MHDYTIASRVTLTSLSMLLVKLLEYFTSGGIYDIDTYNYGHPHHLASSPTAQLDQGW